MRGNWRGGMGLHKDYFSLPTCDPAGVRSYSRCLREPNRPNRQDIDALWIPNSMLHFKRSLRPKTLMVGWPDPQSIACTSSAGVLPRNWAAHPGGAFPNSAPLNLHPRLEGYLETQGT